MLFGAVAPSSSLPVTSIFLFLLKTEYRVESLLVYRGEILAVSSLVEGLGYRGRRGEVEEINPVLSIRSYT